MKDSKTNNNIIEAYNKGYRVLDDGSVSGINVSKRKLNLEDGYYTISLRIKDTTHTNIPVHKLAAFQKFGNEIFKDGIEVRHLDNNSLNNKPENIGIGTHSINCMDKSVETRLDSAIKASVNNRKFSDLEMIEIKNFYRKIRSYKLTMEMFDISSKGTLHYILNTEYKTKK